MNKQFKTTENPSEKNTWALAGFVLSLIIIPFLIWFGIKAPEQNWTLGIFCAILACSVFCLGLSIGACSKAKNECMGDKLVFAIVGICLSIMEIIAFFPAYLHYCGLL